MDLLQALIVPPPVNEVVKAHSDSSSATTSPSAEYYPQDAHDESSTQPTTEPHLEDDSKSAKQSPMKETCFFYYHYGDCTKDPARIKSNKQPCRFSHSPPPPNGRIQIMKRKFHKKPCNLPLCPYKDTPTMQKHKEAVEDQQKAGKATKKAKKAAKKSKKKQLEETVATEAKKSEMKQLAVPAFTAAKEPGNKQALEASISEHNRKKRRYYTDHHPDRPSALAEKRARISYDDLYDSPKENLIVLPLPEMNLEAKHDHGSVSGKTCFFWYHGSCQRTSRRRGCPLKHALTDPPSMVVPPPGFVHREPCNLPWCAGESGPRGHGRYAEVGQQRYFEASVAAEEPVGRTGDSVDQDLAQFFLKGFEEPET